MTTPDVFRLSCLDPNESGNQQSAPAALANAGGTALERRRQKVISTLRAAPALRHAFDVQGAAPGQAVCDVSVMLGLRNSAGTIVTGELRVPATKWPGLAVFTAYWRQAADGRPS